MTTVIGQGTTFNLPNFVGELFAATPADTPFLSAIGGLTGGQIADSTLFTWQGYNLRDADTTRTRVEGAAAPPAENRRRFSVGNVVQVHQETLDVSYTKLASTGQFAQPDSAHAAQFGVGGMNPVVNELDWQTRQALIQIARDVNKSFISGRFANPTVNTAPRRTRGVMEASVSNMSDRATLIGAGNSAIAANGTVTVGVAVALNTPVVARAVRDPAAGNAPSPLIDDNQIYFTRDVTGTSFRLARRLGGPPIEFPNSTHVGDFFNTVPLTEAMILDLLQLVWDNGGISVSETATLMVNSTLKRALTQIFITARGFQETSRNVGGVNMMTFESDFGVLNIMLERSMPSGAVQVVSLDECAPVFLPIPDKGFLFVEPLAKVGAAERSQIYGEIGLRYGNEASHGRLLGVRAA